MRERTFATFNGFPTFEEILSIKPHPKATVFYNNQDWNLYQFKKLPIAFIINNQGNMKWLYNNNLKSSLFAAMFEWSEDYEAHAASQKSNHAKQNH